MMDNFDFTFFSAVFQYVEGTVIMIGCVQWNLFHNFNSLSYRACFETRHIPPKLRIVTINAFGFYFSPAGKIRLYN